MHLSELCTGLHLAELRFYTLQKSRMGLRLMALLELPSYSVKYKFMSEVTMHVFIYYCILFTLNYMQSNFVVTQIQDVVPITSYDTTGSLLLLGCENGSIYNIGKFLYSKSKIR